MMFKGCLDNVHKFEPRYDELFPDWMSEMESITGYSAGGFKEKIYIKDICVRCGVEVKKTND